MKKYKQLINEASGYITGAILQPGVRRDLENWFKRVSTLNHGEGVFDAIDERLAAHGYVLARNNEYELADIDDGGEFQIPIQEVGSGRLVDDGNTVVSIFWERVPGVLNPENSQQAVAKEYRVKINLVTIVDEGDMQVPKNASEVESPLVDPYRNVDYGPGVSK